MIQTVTDHTATPDGAITLLFIEAGLTGFAMCAAYLFPRLGNGFFAAIERAVGKLARHRAAAVLTVGCAMLVLRAAVLPWFPAPKPFCTDDFSFLLAADTFAHGRLTNPTPAMWTHLESIHITMQPTYMSMYFPAQGLVMALGQVFFGHPWAGIFLMSGLMCAALCWMLQGWLPPQWALLGGVIAILRFGLFSYWVNSLCGGAAVSAFSGALILGSLPRLMRTRRVRYALLMALGISLVALTRPYEGVLVSLPVLAVLIYWTFFSRNRPAIGTVLRLAAPSLAIIAVTLGWLGYYDYRAFGKVTTLPYTVSRNTYAVVPYYIWQKMRPMPNYRHEEIRRFYTEFETHTFNSESKSFAGFLHGLGDKLNLALLAFADFALLPPLLMSRRVLLDRRIRFFVCCLGVWIVGMVIGVYFIPHYTAPFTAGIMVLGLQATRHLYVWRPDGKPAGKTVVRLMVTICVAMAVVRLGAKPLNLVSLKNPSPPAVFSWIGTNDLGSERDAVATRLAAIPGKHLVLVRYNPKHDSADEWVYNAADVDASRVVWAREMGAANNHELTQYYKDRDVWLVQPDMPDGERLTPYPAHP